MAGAVISLTSVPPRFAGLAPVLQSLATQGAGEVQLWIPARYDRFPDWDGRLPAVPPGVTVRRCDGDFGPATKFIPALRAMDPDTPLAICDDDAIYAPGWLDALRAMATANPGAAVAGSSFPLARLALDPAPAPGPLVVQGFAGVMLTPRLIGTGAISPRDRMVDDIWLSARLAATGTLILTATEARRRVTPHGSGVAALQDARPGGLSRAQANLRSAAALRTELGIWP